MVGLAAICPGWKACAEGEEEEDDDDEDDEEMPDLADPEDDKTAGKDGAATKELPIR